MESVKLFRELVEQQQKVLSQRRIVTLKEAREIVEWLKANRKVNQELRSKIAGNKKNKSL